MENKNPIWNKIFLGFGIVTVLSGIGLMISDQLLIGISGSLVGVWLIMENMKNIKNQNCE